MLISERSARRSPGELHCGASLDEILPPELLGLSYHLGARRQLDWITR
jgi:hypothetical protein